MVGKQWMFLCIVWFLGYVQMNRCGMRIGERIK